MIYAARFFAVLSASLLLSYSSVSLADTAADMKAAAALEKSLRSLVSSGDFRSASKVAFQLASARSRLGDTPAACAALSQSLDSYRKAVATETGISEPAASSLGDGSDGMAEVRARFGCKRA